MRNLYNLFILRGPKREPVFASGPLSIKMLCTEIRNIDRNGMAFEVRLAVDAKDAINPALREAKVLQVTCSAGCGTTIERRAGSILWPPTKCGACGASAKIEKLHPRHPISIGGLPRDLVFARSGGSQVTVHLLDISDAYDIVSLCGVQAPHAWNMSDGIYDSDFDAAQTWRHRVCKVCLRRIHAPRDGGAR